MPTPPTMRQNILAALKTLYEAVDLVKDPDEPDTFDLKFSQVREGPLSDTDLRKSYSLGIVPGQEKKRDIYPFIECDWQILLEFQALRNSGDNITPMQLAERVLGVVQSVFYANKTLGGVVIDTKELGSELDLETYGDKTIVGVVTIQVKYRHDHTTVYPTV